MRTAHSCTLRLRASRGQIRLARPCLPDRRTRCLDDGRIVVLHNRAGYRVRCRSCERQAGSPAACGDGRCQPSVRGACGSRLRGVAVIQVCRAEAISTIKEIAVLPRGHAHEIIIGRVRWQSAGTARAAGTRRCFSTVYCVSACHFTATMPTTRALPLVTVPLVSATPYWLYVNVLPMPKSA